MVYHDLDDRIHAIMVEEMLIDFNGAIELGKAEGRGNGLLKTEEPFNYYGNRGFVDILHHGIWPIDVLDSLTPGQIKEMGGDKLFNGSLSIIECKPRITNLNDTIRQVTKYSEFVIPDFKKRYPNRPIGICHTALALLNTKENCDLILKFKNTFKAAFQNQRGMNYFETTNRRQLWLFDPLENYKDYYDSTRSLAENLESARQCERKLTIIFDSDNDFEQGIIGEASLQERYHYKDASDFYEQYLEKKEQSK